jgi:hypothetical protein
VAVAGGVEGENAGVAFRLNCHPAPLMLREVTPFAEQRYMERTKRRRSNEVCSTEITVHFSPKSKQALRDLAAAVEEDRHFDADIFLNLKDWCGDEPPTAANVFMTLSPLAQETLQHIATTGDKRAEEAWTDFVIDLADNYPTLMKARLRAR